MVVIFGNQIGYIVDNQPRLHVVIVSLIIQNCMVALCGSFLSVLATFQVNSPFSTFYSSGLFLLAVSCGGIAALSQAASDISIEKDWAIILSEKEELSSTNASLKRIAMICEILAPFAFSILITFTNVNLSFFHNSIFMHLQLFHYGIFFHSFLKLLYLYICTKLNQNYQNQNQFLKRKIIFSQF